MSWVSVGAVGEVAMAALRSGAFEKQVEHRLPRSLKELFR
jgi:hypothetical protein